MSNGGIFESLYWIKHKDTNETYDRATDSLEAISDFLVGFDVSWLAAGLLIDADDFDVADGDADTERWTPEYITGATEGAADISTTTSGELYIKIDSSGAGAREYAVARELPILMRHFQVAADADFTWGTTTATAMRGGIMCSKGATYDATNIIRVYKEKSDTVERVAMDYNLAGAGVASAGTVNTTDDAIAFKLDRTANVWRGYYSLTQGDDAVWVLIGQVEDSAEAMTETVSFYFNIYSFGSAASEDIQVDFDSYRLWNTFGAFADRIGNPLETATGPGAAGSVHSKLRGIMAALGVTAAAGGKFETDGAPDLYTNLGAFDGYTTLNKVSLTAWLGLPDTASYHSFYEYIVTGSDTSANPNITFNADGSVLERLEFLQSILGGTVFESDAATTTTITCAELIDTASQYIGQLVVPLEGGMAGEGRYITAYNGTNLITVNPAWAADPDAGGDINFVIMPSALSHINSQLGDFYNNTNLTTLGAILGEASFDAQDNSFYEYLVTGADTGIAPNIDANIDGSVLERLEHLKDLLLESRISGLHDQSDAAGTEDTLWQVNAPTANWVPETFVVDLTEMVAGDTLRIRVYYRIVSAGNYIKEIDRTFEGDQDPDLIAFDLHKNRYGARITTAQTAGTARDFQWEVYQIR